jgi:TetR/AcrR family transcriptional regulator, cholesterol catabolism regulator
VETQYNIIVQHAFNQFKQFGFKNVTMDEIARQVGISKKTLYELFTDKDNLVYEAVKWMIDDNQHKTDEIFSKSKNAIEQLVNIMDMMETMIKGMNPVCFMEMQRFFPKAYGYLNQHKESCVIHHLKQNLLQGIKEELFRPEINTDIIAQFRLETSFLIFQSVIFPPEKFEILNVNIQIFEHYMYGIATLKGHKLISKYITNHAKN